MRAQLCIFELGLFVAFASSSKIAAEDFSKEAADCLVITTVSKALLAEFSSKPSRGVCLLPPNFGHQLTHLLICMIRPIIAHIIKCNADGQFEEAPAADKV